MIEGVSQGTPGNRRAQGGSARDAHLETEAHLVCWRMGGSGGHRLMVSGVLH